MRRIYFLCWILILPAFLWAQDPAVLQKIRDEGLNHSQVMDIAFQLTEVSGPRLTVSPGYNRASNYSVEQMKKWGLTNVRRDVWGDFGKGWELKKSYAAMTAPWYKPLMVFPKAWTEGTNGLEKSSVILIDARDSAELVNRYKGKLKGKILIMDHPTNFTPKEGSDMTRWTDAQLDSMANIHLTAPDTAAMNARRRRFFNPEFMRARRMSALLNEMAKNERAVAILSSSARNNEGTIFVQGGGSYKVADPANFLDLATSAEDFDMILRLVKHNIPVEIEADVATRFYTDDTKGYNVIGEIKGTDPKLKDEVVMLGGHLDSWQGATGATDNAAGSAVMMEAVRILKTLGIQPRRTIRIALWNGEEQGIFGSREYVKKTFGDRATMQLKQPAHQNFDVYFNLDNGSGRIRGIYLQENEAARSILSQWMSPFKDLGATTMTISNTGGTDHLSFDAVGLPGFQFIQDDIEYETRTHHSNMDSYDHLVPDDLKQAATILAGMVYQAAMSDQKVPRKELPKAQAQRSFF
ncbi:MAG: M20/M25/M40 family metallo-hydrolase [Chitinophagaceae bacterium]|nr:M20/M25/M40 family metallo-hydrolase [Chitinophagaceae bacterium]